VIGAALVVAAQRSGQNTLVVAVVLYVLGCVAAYALHTPVGGTAARLGELTAGPLAALLLVPRRAWLLLALAAIPLTYIQIHDAITDLEHGEVANTAAYYRPLIRFSRRSRARAAHLARRGAVHRGALGGIPAGAGDTARPRLGAPARHRRRRAVLRRRAERGQLPTPGCIGSPCATSPSPMRPPIIRRAASSS